MNAPEAQSGAPLMEMIDATIARPGHDTPLVEGINWRVMRGDYWVVCGLQGAGKTSFLQTAAGLQPVAGGRHLFCGREMAELSAEDVIAERLRVGVVFENGGRLFSQLTVAENIMLPLRYHRELGDAEAWDVAARWLEFMGLAPYAHQMPGRISHLWRQRAALARALVLEPELLLFDNPTTGMDPRQVRWWHDLLAQLSSGCPALGGKPVTLVVAVGDLQPWLGLGRQFALLHRRAWRLLGTRDELAGVAESLMQELVAGDVVAG